MEKKETSIALDIYFSLLCLSLTPLPTQPTLWFCDSQRNTVMAVGSLQTLSELRKMSPAPAESVATKPCLTDISAHNGFHLSWSWVSPTLLSSSEKLSAAEDSDTNSSQDCAVGASSYSWKQWAGNQSLAPKDAGVEMVRKTARLSSHPPICLQDTEACSAPRSNGHRGRSYLQPPHPKESLHSPAVAQHCTPEGNHRLISNSAWSHMKAFTPSVYPQLQSDTVHPWTVYNLPMDALMCRTT